MEERRKYKSRRKEGPDMAKQHNYLCRKVKKSAKEDKERYIREVCNKIEENRSGNKTRAVYEGIRKITGTHAPRVKSIKDENDILITEPEKVKERWREYFDKLYNDPNKTEEACLNNMTEKGNMEDIPPLGEDEVEAAINNMKKGKAPGVDNITAEELQAGTEGLGMQVIHRLCLRAWESEEIPSDWKRAIVIPIHKKKDRLDCANYRGTSLLCHSSKVFSTIILQRIRKRT